MLRKVGEDVSQNFINFGSIMPNSNGRGIAYCYNAVAKKTQAGKPFITLHLRDAQGAAVPAYCFDLSQPLLAGKEITAAIGMPLLIEWQENYLHNVGLTLLVDKVSIVTDLSPEHLGLFTGAIDNVDNKLMELQDFFDKELKFNVAMPFWVKTHSSIDYCQGRVGGLCEHYWRMMNNLRGITHLTAEEHRRLIGTFLIYTFVHANYVRLSEAGKADISTVASLTENVNKLNVKLNLGPGILEVVHMFFGYKPKDIYVRTIAAISDQVHSIDREFALYKTIPLTQEGDAGYGKIRRYSMENPS